MRRLLDCVPVAFCDGEVVRRLHEKGSPSRPSCSTQIAQSSEEERLRRRGRGCAGRGTRLISRLRLRGDRRTRIRVQVLLAYGDVPVRRRALVTRRDSGASGRELGPNGSLASCARPASGSHASGIAGAPVGVLSICSHKSCVVQTQGRVAGVYGRSIARLRRVSDRDVG
jgi:hypothetical protein